jgi:hypothetical protein
MRSTCVALVCLACVAPSAHAQGVSFTASSYPSVTGARGAVAADLNRDGWPDVATANAVRNSVTVLLNDGAGGFRARAEIAVGTGPFDIDAGDFDRDGHVDLAVSTPDSNAIQLLFMNGAGTLRSRLVLAGAGDSRGLRLADVTGDGWLDLIYSVFSRNTVVVLPNNQTGGFFSDIGEYPTGTGPQGVTVADFDHDGEVDVAVANTGSTFITFLLGSGDATSTDFTPWNMTVGAGRAQNVLTAADVNGDSWVDLALASTSSNTLSIYPNSAHGWSAATTYATGSSPRGIAAADLDQDGRLDLITANRGSNSVSVLVSAASSFGFEPPRQFAAGGGARAVAAADFDNDGLIDLVTGNEYTASITRLDNTTPRVRPGFSFRRETFGGDLNSSGASAVGDFNENGRLDVLAGDRVLLDGTTVIDLSPPDRSVVDGDVADVNGDGHQDVVVTVGRYDVSTGAAERFWEIYAGNGSGGFTAAASVSSGTDFIRQSVLADLDRDGRLDIAAISTTALTLAYQRVPGVFTLETSSMPSGTLKLDLADVNHDGLIDVLAAVYEAGLAVRLRQADGSYGETRLFSVGGSRAEDVAAGDLDHDGRLDVVLADWGRVTVLTGDGDGAFAMTHTQPLSGFSGRFVLADLTNDGHLDVLTAMGGLLTGTGDGRLNPEVRFASDFSNTVVADWNRDGLLDLVMGDAAVLNERRATNRRPVAHAGPDLTMQYQGQFAQEATYLDAQLSSDPDLHALTYEWRDENGIFATTNDWNVQFSPRAPGTYVFTLTVRDGRGGEHSDTMRLTITPSPEIVLWGGYYGGVAGWETVIDPSAAADMRVHAPNAGAPKVNAPAVAPANYVDVHFYPDPTQTYKLWVRLKADGNRYENDSLWMQFSSAVNTSGAPIAPIGTTQGLAINLEECSGCGISGWGWEDDGWGAKNANGTLLRFAEGGFQTIRIQVREDGVSFDQIVLSAGQYLTARPGAAKNDNTILMLTQEPE